ncbi:MAG: DNA integrity scanning diadenylate cyclase DisA [Candidatus ainarchaeum sp.]|nr:DNA integrity scanning diadenylate cyclase DisA [Patescibacteria group bacterium]MDD2478059.1 DNA integrity scanning diadenylate cyclase DisA [Candidatus ainarchaeum sp.]MDD3084613.1 DNA integrity scanning diadenylate cyclase DisA [Candidatus ainarchaeum sp.]MDD4221098.1 DNA integrity scanning diadenylate cyclase DisA [Candidatus ainarchaeum sp.]MDD4662585.1 DNA integrity scanning diadenylate cyclase DisA [Candidatus ainarchaeum sp.]
MSVKIKINQYLDENWTDELIQEIHRGEIIDINKILPIVTPGNDLRRGLDEILHGKLGALVVLGSNEELAPILKGGFDLDIPFSSQKLFELSKMDGAIILSNDLKRITGANKHLMPDKEVPSSETGMRHRSAEQTAIQSNLPVIAISHRRSIISLYFRDQKYVLQDPSFLTVKANYSLNNLKDYRQKIDSNLNKLLYSEFNLPTKVFDQVIEIIQKILYFFKHGEEMEKIVVELGNQGSDISQTLSETTFGLDEELSLLLMDYSQKPITKKEAEEKVEYLLQLGVRKITDKNILINSCEIENKDSRGYRILYKIPKLDFETIDKLIKTKKTISNIKSCSAGQLALIDGLNSNKAKYILSQLNRLNEDILEDEFNFQ